MSRWANVRILVAALLLALLPNDLGAANPRKPAKFVPPDVFAVTDIPDPMNGAAGMAGLSINLDSSAAALSVQVIRALPSLTDTSLAAVNGWTFAAATLNGKPCAANLPVAIVFDPGNPISQSIPLPPRLKPTEPSKPEPFTPAEVSMARFIAYPAHSNAYGTLVLDVTVNTAGRPSRLSVIRGRVESLEKPVLAAVKKWRFKPGTLDGVPVNSKLVVAFVFRSPSIPSS